MGVLTFRLPGQLQKNMLSSDALAGRDFLSGETGPTRHAADA
jgi:hypothetical protein